MRCDRMVDTSSYTPNVEGVPPQRSLGRCTLSFFHRGVCSLADPPRESPPRCNALHDNGISPGSRFCELPFGHTTPHYTHGQSWGASSAPPAWCGAPGPGVAVCKLPPGHAVLPAAIHSDGVVVWSANEGR